MVSASVLALSYVLFMTSLFTGERFMIEIAAIVSGSIWFAHVLYFTFFLELAAVSERYPYVPALDEIGEKLMRRILTGFKRIRFEPMGGIQDVFVLFIISFLIRLMFPIFTRPLISLLPPIIPLVLQLIILFLSLFVVASYLLRYLTVRLDIINAYRHRKSSRSLAILHWKPTSCADKRLKDAVYALSYSIKWRSKEMPDDVMDSFGNSLLSWRVLFAREYSEGGSLANKEYWRFGTPDKPMDMTKSWDDPENLAAAVPKPLVYYYPGETEAPDEVRTCVLRIKEVHEWIKATDPISHDRALKVYLVLVSPENAVPWTRPFDVSWKDLASGGVKLYESKPIVFTDASGDVWTIDELPKAPDDWKRFLGIDKAVEMANEVKNDRSGWKKRNRSVSSK